MHGKLKLCFVFLFQIFSFVFARAFDEGDGILYEKFREISESGDENTTRSIEFNDGVLISDATLRTTVKRFQCDVKNVSDSVLLVNGAKSWKFSRQDVNLTLSYPTAEYEGFPSYKVTSVQVTLFIDGMFSKGYITSGGLLQESISLSFVCRNITMLSYNFKLYGIQNYPVVPIDTNISC